MTLVCERLPEPTEFGDGNPFLIFLCMACLLQHRSQIMKQGYDYQEIAMYFDRMVRKHDVEQTLSIARKLFAEYLNDEWISNTTANPVAAGNAQTLSAVEGSNASSRGGQTTQFQTCQASQPPNGKANC